MNIKDKLNDGFLELYDGQMALANKKTLITDNLPELKFTARGKELFALSESLYGKYLTEGGGVALAERAVEMCALAVKQGYPHAVVKMAFYYDKDYIEIDRTEEFRCRVACDYYGKVAYYDGVPKCDDGVTPEMGWEELKRLAARMLMDMLATAPPSLTGDKDGKYSYEYNRALIEEKLQISTGSPAKIKRSERDRQEQIEKVFKACKHNKTRAPLFGVVQLSAAQALNVFSQKSAAMKLCGDLNIWINNGERVVRVNNTTAFKEFAEKLTGEDIWVYFFNNNLGGHRYLSGAQRNALCDLMMKDNFARFLTLAQSAKERERGEYLFSDDDIFFFLSGLLTPLKTALDALIEKVTSDKEWSDL